MSDTRQPEQRKVYRPTDSKLIESFSKEVAKRLSGYLSEKESRISFARDLTALLNVAAKIKAKYLNNQHQKTAVTTRKGEN
jgi:hypothetical protein